MDRLTFFVPGIPRPKGSKRAFIVRRRDTGQPRAILAESSAEGLKPWLSLVTLAAQTALRGQAGWMEREALRLSLTFCLPRPKSLPKRVQYPVFQPDVGKLARAIEDALTSVLYRDDSQIVQEVLEKQYGAQPGVAILVESLEP